MGGRFAHGDNGTSRSHVLRQHSLVTVAVVHAMPPMHDMYGMGSDPTKFALSAFPASYALELHHWSEAAQLAPVSGASDSDLAVTYAARAIGAARSGNAEQARKEVAQLEATLESISSCHKPSRAKMCEGICTACAEAGAMLAYFRAAGSAKLAICGLSQL
jgi:hypothetical protein